MCCMYSMAKLNFVNGNTLFHFFSGKPHLSSLSFLSLINLKIQLERGLLLLDVQANDMDHILKDLVDQWISIGKIHV